MGGSNLSGLEGNHGRVSYAAEGQSHDWPAPPPDPRKKYPEAGPANLFYGPPTTNFGGDGVSE